jgi:hypothetical protein
MKYTEGKWEVGIAVIPALGTFQHVVVAIPSMYKVVASTGMAGADDESESIANAQLIAAAPEMYEALKQIAKGEGRYSQDPLTHASNTIDDMKELAKAALAKAEGAK